MVYRKAVYQVIDGEMVEKVTESAEECWAACNSDWHDHPETARNAVVEVVEENKTIEQMDRKELVAYGAVLGIEIDKRKSQKNMLAEIKQLID